jgi:hypothetical protein
MINQVNQNWNNNAWLNQSRDTLSYDANNNMISYLIQTWNTNAWHNSGLNTYTFDANNNKISFLSQQWNGNSWVRYSQNLWDYDLNNFLTGNSFKNFYTDVLIAPGDSTHYYFHTVVGINNLAAKDDDIMVYPNPATSEFVVQSGKFKVERIEIYNVVGERVFQRALTPGPSPSGEGSVSVDVSSLGEGIYFVKVFDGERSVVKRFVKM